MKRRVLWGLAFYLVLLCFIFYDLAYLLAIEKNQKLFDLFNEKFYYTNTGNQNFTTGTLFILYRLPLIGVGMNLIGMFLAMAVPLIPIKQKHLRLKTSFLLISLIVLIIGFYTTFVSQLYYSNWDNTSVIITPKGMSAPGTASDYYLNWIGITAIWSIFGLFFGLIALSLLLILKIHFLNVEALNYLKRDIIEPEINIRRNIIHQTMFDPQKTQVLTIDLHSKQIKPKLKPVRKVRKTKKHKPKKS